MNAQPALALPKNNRMGAAGLEPLESEFLDDALLRESLVWFLLLTFAFLLNGIPLHHVNGNRVAAAQLNAAQGSGEAELKLASWHAQPHLQPRQQPHLLSS